MKKISFLMALVAILGFSRFATSQINSVELQDGGGSLLSQHASIEEAYNAIPGTIAQAYIIEILSAYDGSSELLPIDLTVRSGSSSVNTITIRPDAGNTGEVISGNNTAGIIKIDNSDYIIIDGRPGGTGSTADLEIRNSATTGTNSNTIEMLNGTSNCIVRYCNLYNATQGTAGPRVVEFSASAADVLGNSDNLVEYCLISGGRSGVGSDGTVANPNRNNRVSNNNIVDFGFAGVWALNGTKSIIIEGNTMSTPGANVTNPSGINLQSTLDSSEVIVRNNKVINIGSTSTSATGLNVRGIYTAALPGTGSVISIYNNFVALNLNNQSVASTFGIYTTGTTEGYTLNIHNNTVVIGGTQTGGTAGRLVSAGIVKQSTNSGMIYNQRNNICVNNRTGGTSGVIHAGAAFNGIDGLLDIDYNCYYATGSSEGTNSYPVTWDSVGYDNTSSYASISGEDNVRFKNVTFISGTDLHLDGSSIQDADLSARPIAGITTDIDGDSRSTSFPYKGADESTAFTLSTLNLTVNLEAYSPVQDTVIVSLRSSTSPYGLVEMSKAYLSPSGTATVNFAKAVNGTNYYVVVNHRNSIETWSKAGGEVFTAGSLTYNFTTSASQAFGSNMVLVGGEYSFYTGDSNQDGTVDAADLSLIDNDAFNFISGYVVTDLNGDMSVDGTDLSFCDNNAANFVGVVRP